MTDKKLKIDWNLYEDDDKSEEMLYEPSKIEKAINILLCQWVVNVC